ncbi:MAG TPA: hypothetical protein VK966_07395, partial [Longimicrobiales bacterium]|nr:hypothetical protein [Longimicrobiales bacterium]
MRGPSPWSRTSPHLRGGGGLLAALVLASGLTASPASAQSDGMDDVCAGFGVAAVTAECRLAVGAARVIQPRVAVALFGGNPVPGTASTLGMRLGSLPRLSGAARITLAPAEVPPALDRTATDGDRAYLFGFTADGSVGLLTGFSPLP